MSIEQLIKDNKELRGNIKTLDKLTEVLENRIDYLELYIRMNIPQKAITPDNKLKAV